MIFPEACRLGQVGADPQPVCRSRQGPERLEQDRLAHASKTGDDQVLENRSLPEQAAELLLFLRAAGKPRGRVASSRPKRVQKTTCTFPS